MQSSFQSVHIVNKTKSSTKSEGLFIGLRLAILSLLFLISPCCAMVKLVLGDMMVLLDFVIHILRIDYLPPFLTEFY